MFVAIALAAMTSVSVRFFLLFAHSNRFSDRERVTRSDRESITATAVRN
jgi:hypothetical protein